MSRFGTTAQFLWDTGDTFAGGSTITLNEQDMPQYPMEETRVSDEQRYLTKSGREYSTRNYLKRSFIFNWTDLSESKRDELANMADNMPIFQFSSGGNDFGTFRMEPDSFQDSETSFELYDVSFGAVEDI